MTVGPSPQWLRSKLEAVGLRSINNIVDISNFVMLELGQPTHAFDADKLKGDIVVRLARDGEKFLALDGKTYTLTAQDLVIADQERVVGPWWGDGWRRNRRHGCNEKRSPGSRLVLSVEHPPHGPDSEFAERRELSLRAPGRSRHGPARFTTGYGIDAGTGRRESRARDRHCRGATGTAVRRFVALRTLQ